VLSNSVGKMKRDSFRNRCELAHTNRRYPTILKDGVRAGTRGTQQFFLEEEESENEDDMHHGEDGVVGDVSFRYSGHETTNFPTIVQDKCTDGEKDLATVMGDRNFLVTWLAILPGGHCDEVL
jgi:hypothetical protein